MRLLITILQVALGIFTENPELSAGNLCGYFPQDTLVSEVPKGYKPFYISHIARHGSRYLGNSASKYFHAIDTLDFYAARGMLTADGLSLRDDLKAMYDMTVDHFGDLTELGALEHRQICSRMVRHYPEVFSNGKRTHVEAFTTPSPRVVASMDSFISELAERSPNLVIDTFKTDWGEDAASQEVNGYNHRLNDALKEDVNKEDRRLRKLAKEINGGNGDFHAFAERIFLEPETIPYSTVYFLARYSYKVIKTGRVTEPAVMPSMGKYYTATELYALWVDNGISWLKFMSRPDYESPLATTRGYGIVDRIVKDADDAINAGSTSAATLRFSHDTYLLPLMAAIPLEGTVLECDRMEFLEHFQDFNFICPGCNVQLVFYRKKCGGPILVKFLLNEKETLIHGLAPKTGCYYDWEAVKKFWAARMQA